jgi:hypothetical protein
MGVTKSNVSESAEKGSHDEQNIRCFGNIGCCVEWIRTWFNAAGSRQGVAAGMGPIHWRHNSREGRFVNELGGI